MGCTLQNLIRYMLATSGKTAAQVSRELGNDSNHLSVILSSGRTPRLDLFVKIAECCGYVVELHELQDFESWELVVENGSVSAVRDHGPEDMEALSRGQADARDALKNWGKRELLDELIGNLQQMRDGLE